MEWKLLHSQGMKETYTRQVPSLRGEHHEVTLVLCPSCFVPLLEREVATHECEPERHAVDFLRQESSLFEQG